MWLTPERLRCWQRTIADGNEAVFVRRLAWDGYTFTGGVVRAQTDRAPSRDMERFRTTFEHIMGGNAREMCARYRRLDDESPDRVLNPKAPLPFEVLFIPFVREARCRLQAETGALYEKLNARSHIVLEQWLLSRLCNLCGGFLRETLDRFRERHPEGDGNEAFVRSLQEGAFYDLFTKYPVAARLCVRVWELWLEACKELILRLADDWEELSRLFGEGRSFGKVTHLQAGLSDPHAGGRTVVIVTFDGVTKVVYKPRPLGMEQYFGDLQRWVNAHGGLLPLRPLRLLTREDYGWVEYVAPAPCPDEEAVRRYFRRCGMLLALIYVTGGTDFHRENLIACGEHPMLLDMEVLLRHRLPFTTDTHAGNPLLHARARMEDSVYWTELLPFHHFGNGGTATMVGALGEEPGNSDHRPNVLRLGMDVVASSRWTEEVVAGFRHTYRLLLDHRAALLKRESPFLSAHGCEGRFLFRNTALYSKILRLGCKPRYLRDGIDRSILIDSLSRVMAHLEEPPPTWPVLEAERQALEQLDVPILTTRADSRDLYLPGGEKVKDFFSCTALEAVEARLEGLCEEDLAFQTRIMRDCMYGQRGKGLTPPYLYERESERERVTVAFSPALALEEAMTLGDRVMAEVHRGPEGSLLWYGLDYQPAAQRYRVGMLGGNLFFGLGGVTLFLAALARISGEDRFYEGARRTMLTLHAHAEAFEQAVEVSRGLEAAARGLGSLLYSFVLAAYFLDDPSLRERAMSLAALLDERVFRKAPAPGIIGGWAGMLLGLLALYDASGRATALERAREVGRHLTERRDRWGWPLQGRQRAGFAQGTSGIAYALLGLYERTEEEPFLDAARSVLTHEMQTHPVDCSVDGSWGYGLAGYVATRMQARAVLGETDHDEELETMLSLLGQCRCEGCDTLATGVFGRLDVLIVAAEKERRKGLLQRAHAIAAEAMGAARMRGGYRTGWKGNVPVGLLNGLAGIGYELLRLSDPQMHPGLLTLDPPPVTPAHPAARNQPSSYDRCASRS
ncbi:type 2 lanthipeptide synthetase LanM [Rhodocaloribacter sp.]